MSSNGSPEELSYGMLLEFSKDLVDSNECIRPLKSSFANKLQSSKSLKKLKGTAPVIMILVDTVILVTLLKVVNDDEIEVLTAGLIALVTSIGTAALVYALGSAMGIWGIVIAAFAAAAGLGVAVSSLFGVEIKRSMLIGCLFMVIHIVVNLGINLAFAL